LPETLRNRNKGSDLTPVFNALVAAQKNTLDDSLEASSAQRQRYLGRKAADTMSRDNQAAADWLACSFRYWFSFVADLKKQ
jgi:hypothetical protein